MIKRIPFLFLFLSLLSAKVYAKGSSSLMVVENGPLRIWSHQSDWRDDPDFSIAAGTTIKILTNPSEKQKGLTPSFAQAFVIVDEKGNEGSEVYFLSKKVLEANALPLEVDVNDVVETIDLSSPETCSAQNDPSHYKLGTDILRDGFSTDPNYTYQVAEDFALTGNFGSEEKLQIVTRKEWGASPPTVPLTPLRQPESIVIHHSVTGMNKTPREIQQMHQGGRGWDDIGYNYVVAWDESDNEWKVYEGRVMKDSNGKSIPAQGAHVKGYNDKSIGVVVIGNFAPADSDNPGGFDPNGPDNQKQIPREAIAKIGLLIEKLKSDYPSITELMSHGKDSSHVTHAHHHINHAPGAKTECPGEGMVHIAGALETRYFARGEKP